MLAEIKGINEECGLFGIWQHQDAAHITYYGLQSLQHRGQEGTGIVINDGINLKAHKGEGLVTEVFSRNDIEEMKGYSAIGHVRYSTKGDRNFENIQPLLFHSHTGNLALAHNGSLINAKRMRALLEAQGSIFQTASDTEILAHLIKRSKQPCFIAKVKAALNMLIGAYAFLIMTDDELIAALDPSGIHPLSIGKLGDSYVIASETCAFDIIGAEFIRDVQPGELIIINKDGIHSDIFAPQRKMAMCAMEYVYFARPDSNLRDINVHTARKNLGKQLAIEAPIDADVVTGVPDSSISAAIGYAEESGIPYELGLIKNRYVGRTFIQPTQALREQGVKMKLSPVRGVVEGKRVIMVDDSIVRGTTSKRIVKMLKDAGAKEVHVVISSPPIEYPCFYGIDTTEQDELIAAGKSVEEIRQLIGADTLTFLSKEGLLKALNRKEWDQQNGSCLACFTGEYPTITNDEIQNDKDLMRAVSID
jgi:amidophosphoribosyltransferase